MFANISKFEKKKKNKKKKTCTLVSFSDSSSYITMKAKIAFMPITIQRCIAAQWISVEFLSDAVMRGGDAAGQFVHTTGSTYMQRCCLSSLCSNKSLTLAKHHLTVPEVKLTGRLKRPIGSEAGVCKLPVVGYSDTLRTNKAFKKEKNLFSYRSGEWHKICQYSNLTICC